MLCTDGTTIFTRARMYSTKSCSVIVLEKRLYKVETSYFVDITFILHSDPIAVTSIIFFFFFYTALLKTHEQTKPCVQRPRESVGRLVRCNVHGKRLRAKTVLTREGERVSKDFHCSCTSRHQEFKKKKKEKKNRFSYF